MVKIVIERKVMPECIEQYDKKSTEALQVIFRATGFISSESLQDTREPNHRYLMINFDNIYNWNRWYKSETRRNAVAEMLQMLEEPEKITILKPQPRS